ncbi:TolC family protein [Calidithermus roseus]|uniref:Outer membrane efflux protein n=1 Tax=Calidithermus roseus TaxID=1644118 RepID=A0A399EYX4_9DEIN|nr:TolC family protein [Calidithermus roseus]RIH88229.1 Outer membrane efflux protein [Calidithermus roseus]
MHRSLISLLTLIFFSLAQAQSLDAFLKGAYLKDSSYLEAGRALEAAQDELRRVQGDPEAAPLSLTRAQEGVALAQAKLVQARKEADARALEAYTGVLLAQTDFNLARARKELSALQLQAAELRFKAGAISATELARVRDQDNQAANALSAAERALEQARSRLRPYGEVGVQALPEPDPLDPGKFSLEGHARLLEAQQQVREAERALVLASGPDTAPLDKSARERDLSRARAALSDLQRTLADALEAARNRYRSAVESYRLARETQARSASELEAARKRFAAGSIAQLALKQSEITKAEADRGVLAAQIELWQAIYGLRVAGNG